MFWQYLENTFKLNIFEQYSLTEFIMLTYNITLNNRQLQIFLLLNRKKYIFKILENAV